MLGTRSRPPWRAVALLVAGAFFMENLDGTIIATAAPRMAGYLQLLGGERRCASGLRDGVLPHRGSRAARSDRVCIATARRRCRRHSRAYGRAANVNKGAVTVVLAKKAGTASAASGRAKW